MAKQAFDKQAAARRHAYVEGPLSGLHWKTKTWQKLKGEFCRLDQCDGATMPNQKPTGLHSQPTTSSYKNHEHGMQG
eukprot:2188573-Pyramimonas_sp.AAC.1